MESTTTKKRKLKKRFLIPVIIIVLLLIAALYYFQFSAFGYRMSVPFRNFTEIRKNVYVDNGYSGDMDEVKSIVDEATARVSDFWGDVQSSPVIIISDTEKTISKLGGDHDTQTAVFFKAYSYISLSDEFLNVDILAHELTHAELHDRIYKGKLIPTKVPIWFDEGIATQNDYREQYDDDEWIEKTDNGSKVIPLDKIDQADEFYAGDVDTIRLHYIVSRHEVKQWLKTNGMDSLDKLIEGVNKGENFTELYDDVQ